MNLIINLIDMLKTIIWIKNFWALGMFKATKISTILLKFLKTVYK